MIFLAPLRAYNGVAFPLNYPGREYMLTGYRHMVFTSFGLKVRFAAWLFWVAKASCQKTKNLRHAGGTLCLQKTVIST
jgi:hypothetical protein